MKTALAMIFPPISLAIEPYALRPSSDTQSYFNGSSDLRTVTVAGIEVGQAPRLLDSLHSPSVPSLKDKAIGVIASSVSVAQPTMAAHATASKKFFTASPLVPHRYR